MRPARPARPALAGLLLLAACGDGERDPAAARPPERSGAPWLADATEASGIAFTHETGHAGRCLFPEIIAGGCGLLDLDQDGDLDAYLVQSGHLAPGAPPSPPNALFENDGAGRFRDVTEASGAGDRGYGMGLAAGDVDGDGLPEPYVLNLAENVLFANRGGLRFEDATAASGLADPSWSVSAAFFDAENDGDLDLFVVNYIAWELTSEIECSRVINEGPDYCSPKQYQAPAPDSFFRNDGTGVFVDASAAAGLRTAFGNGLGVVCLDYDDDGYSDVFVANDGTPNQLWHNDGEGFVDQAKALGFAYDLHGFAKAGMGIAAGDVDRDGDEDVIVVNQGGESDSLYRNDAGRFLFDSTLQFGLGAATRPFTRFGVAFVDLDNDGLLDLYEANGRVERASDPIASDPYAEENLLLRGVPGGRFEEVLPRGGTARPLIATSRGAAFGDVDGDGGVDVLVINRDGPAHLLRNVVSDRGHWLLVRLVERSGSPAVGATLELPTPGGEPTRQRVRSAYSYASANEPALHLGLGERTELPWVVVRWVDGTSERFGPLAADRAVTLRRGEGR